MVIFIFLGRRYPFWVNLVQKFKRVSQSVNKLSKANGTEAAAHWCYLESCLRSSRTFISLTNSTE